MSLSISKAVWERAQARGTDLVILLCLADFADEDGVAAPSVATIAKRVRILPRPTQSGHDTTCCPKHAQARAIKNLA